MSNEQQYLNLLQELVDKADNNPIRSDRTGVGTWSVFGRTIEFDLTDMKIPLLTTKKMNYSNILHELYWMFRLKNENTDYLDENNVTIWKEWYTLDNKTGKNYLGKMYGQILRDESYDQLQYVIDLLKRNPTTRRAVFTLFDPKASADERLSFQANADLGRGVLNNCHALANQFIINDKGNLEFLTFQRSQDLFLGGPYNHAFYATFTHLIAHVLGIKAEKMIYVTGDTHLYSNHLEQAKLQLLRDPYKSPTISIDKSIINFDDWSNINQITLHNYNSHAFIKAPVAV